MPGACGRGCRGDRGGEGRAALRPAGLYPCPWPEPPRPPAHRPPPPTGTPPTRPRSTSWPTPDASTPPRSGRSGRRPTCSTAPSSRPSRCWSPAPRRGGTVLVTGLGKSGLIGAKISATLASLGIPSHPVHPAEAAHGDLGRFRRTDTVICLSRSGETDEVVNLAAILRQDTLPIISITGGTPPRQDGTDSAHRAASNASRRSPSTSESLPKPARAPRPPPPRPRRRWCWAMPSPSRPRGGAVSPMPTSPSRHPGGTLGGLLRPVGDILRVRIGPNCPTVGESTPILEAIGAGPGRRAGAVLVVDDGGRLTGIFTDADLRRKLSEQGPGEWMRDPIATVMTRSPVSLAETAAGPRRGAADPRTPRGRDPHRGRGGRARRRAGRPGPDRDAAGAGRTGPDRCLGRLSRRQTGRDTIPTYDTTRQGISSARFLRGCRRGVGLRARGGRHPDPRADRTAERQRPGDRRGVCQRCRRQPARRGLGREGAADPGHGPGQPRPRLGRIPVGDDHAAAGPALRGDAAAGDVLPR
ncbi:MAG: SIS domain-containing protein [Planctomycetota bacterium]|nr:MAG: SIS domain-containing protein [Planctomycetota bacterium]